MALDAYVTPGELERQANLVFHGKPVKIWACNNQDDLKLTSKAQLWANKRLTDEVGSTIGEGTYDAITGEFEVPPIVVRFQSNESILRYDTICVWIDPENAEYLHSIQVENPPVQMNPGSYRTYLIYFAQDDGPNFAIPIKFGMGFGEYYLWGGHVQFQKIFPEDSSVSAPGTFTIKGFSAGWHKEFPLNSSISEPGSYGLAGTSVTFTAPIPHYHLAAVAGTILATGQEAVLNHLGDVDMAADAGEFLLEGQMATGGRTLSVGNFALTGQDAELAIPALGSSGGRMYKYSYPNWYPDQGNGPPNVEEDSYPSYTGNSYFCGDTYPVNGLCLYPRDADRVSMPENEGFEPGVTYYNREVWITFKKYPTSLADWHKYIATELFLTQNDPAVSGDYIWMSLEADPNPPGGGVIAQDMDYWDGEEQTNYNGIQDYRITFVEPADGCVPPPEWNQHTWTINPGGPEKWANEEEFPGELASVPPGSCCYFSLMDHADEDGNPVDDKLIQDIVAGQLDTNGGNILDASSAENPLPWFNLEGMMSWDGGETWGWIMVNLNQVNVETGPVYDSAEANGVWVSPLTPYPLAPPYAKILPNGDQTFYETFSFAFPNFVPFSYNFSLKDGQPAPIKPEDRKRYEQWRKSLPKKLRPSAMPKDPPTEGSK